MPIRCRPCGAAKPPECGSAAPAVLPCDKYQCNKSLLVIQEATKNDRAAIPKKLIEYLLQLQHVEETAQQGGSAPPAAAAEKPKVQTWCTAREQSAWIITQLHDIFLTQQCWSVIKVYFLIHGLLWKGSRVFIEEFHRRLESDEMQFFDFHAALAWREVAQTNPTGAELPSVFDPQRRAKIYEAEDDGGSGGERACGGGGRATEGLRTALDAAASPERTREHGGVKHALHDAWVSATSPPGTVLQSSDEMKRSPVVEAHIANYVAYLESLAHYRYDYPQVDLRNVLLHDDSVRGPAEPRAMRADELQGLMMATMELMKSIVANSVDAPPSPVSNMIVLFRCLNAHILYKIGAQVLTGYANLFVHRFLALLDDADKAGLGATEDMDRLSSRSVVGSGSDVFKAPRLTSFEEYEALAPREKLALIAREWYTTVYQFNRTSEQLRHHCFEVQQMVGVQQADPAWLRVLPPETFSMMRAYGSLHPSRGGCPWCGSEADTPACHPEGEHRVPPCAVHLVSAWRQQVKNVQSFFSTESPIAADVLQQLERELADKEKELLTIISTGSPTGLTPNRQSAEFHTSTLTGTFIIRRKGPDSATASPHTPREDVEVMYLDQLMDKTTDSIEAMLHDDDVVVVCPDDFSATDRLKLADRFVVLKERPLGEGSYGKVYRAWDELLGSYLAAKEVPLDSSKGTAAAVHEALHEYTILTQLHHPHIVAVRAFMVTGSVGTIFMEWMPSGSLQEVLRSNPRGCLREPVVARFMRDALRGLEYLHSRDIMHRDVKPANMLLGTDGSVKLTDFGNSFVMAEGRHTIENSTITGTAPYIAPECAQGTYSPAGDVWSLGCTAVELLSGLVPWSDPVTGSRPETVALIFRIGMLDDKTRTDRPHTLMWDNMVKKAGKAGLSPELRSFLDAIFVVDRHARPTATQLLQHPFIRRNNSASLDE